MKGDGQMSENLAIYNSQPYMKGRSRHIFWPVLAFLLLSSTLDHFYHSLATALAQAAPGNMHGAVAILLPLAVDGIIFIGWVAFFLAYGLKMTTKSHKVLFIALALLQLPRTIGDFEFHYFLTKLIMGDTRLIGSFEVFNALGTALNILANVGCAACLAVFLFNRKSGALLRVASAVLAIYYLYISMYLIASPYLISMLNNNMGSEAYSTVMAIVNAFHAVIRVAATAFFFAAISFGRRSPAGVPASASVAPAHP